EMFRQAFERAYAAKGDVDYWDYQWTFACWTQDGLSILPNVSLVSNLGFGPSATHTTGTSDIRATVQRGAMRFPLEHPSFVAPDQRADRLIVEQVILPQLGVSNARRRPLSRLASLVPSRWRPRAAGLVERLRNVSL